MVQQLDIYGHTKEEESIEFIKEYEPSDGYYLGFSGGKDSIVLYDLAKRSNVKFTPCYAATGIDAPEVMLFIRDKYPDVKWLRPNYKGHRSFFGMIPIRGFPTKFTRWCCDELKKNPGKQIKLNHRLMGIRREESQMRAKRPRIEKRGKDRVYKPIFDWLEWEVWEYIDRYNLPYCSLYDEGFDRLGCVVCPFLCHGRESKKLKRHMERWPKHYKAFEKSMKRLWVRGNHGKPWRESTVEEFIENWYKGN